MTTAKKPVSLWTAPQAARTCQALLNNPADIDRGVLRMRLRLAADDDPHLPDIFAAFKTAAQRFVAYMVLTHESGTRVWDYQRNRVDTLRASSLAYTSLVNEAIKANNRQELALLCGDDEPSIMLYCCVMCGRTSTHNWYTGWLNRSRVVNETTVVFHGGAPYRALLLGNPRIAALATDDTEGYLQRGSAVPAVCRACRTVCSECGTRFTINSPMDHWMGFVSNNGTCVSCVSGSLINVTPAKPNMRDLRLFRAKFASFGVER